VVVDEGKRRRRGGGEGGFAVDRFSAVSNHLRCPSILLQYHLVPLSATLPVPPAFPHLEIARNVLPLLALAQLDDHSTSKQCSTSSSL
jgi:hypothetical protein